MHVETAKEITYGTGSNAIVELVSFGLYVNTIKPQCVLVNNTIYAVVTCLANCTPCFSKCSAISHRQ